MLGWRLHGFDVVQFVAADKKASEYTHKHCRACDMRDACEICLGCRERGSCKPRTNPKLKQGCERRLERVCGKQSLKWEAIQCVCDDSEYYRSLLNVTPHGNKQSEVSWKGCYQGERRCGI
jgi:hypothetical protein